MDNLKPISLLLSARLVPNPSSVFLFPSRPVGHSRLDERDGGAVKADLAAAGGDVGHCGSSLLVKNRRCKD